MNPFVVLECLHKSTQNATCGEMNSTVSSSEINPRIQWDLLIGGIIYLSRKKYKYFEQSSLHMSVT